MDWEYAVEWNEGVFKKKPTKGQNPKPSVFQTLNNTICIIGCSR